MKTVFDYYTIEPSYNDYGNVDGWWVIGWGEYEESSVLAGQTQKARLKCYDNFYKAQEDYPDAELMIGPSINPARVPDCPPEGFDPADAGEVWGEDDY